MPESRPFKDLTYYDFEELDLLPPDKNGYTSGIMVAGQALVSFSMKSRNWVIAGVTIRHMKTILDHSRPFGEHKFVGVQQHPAPEWMLPLLIARLSEASWRSAIQDHVDEVCAEEQVDENRYADMAP